MAGETGIRESGADGMVLRTEYRISRMLVFVRVGTSFFAYLPLFVWGSLARPWIAVCAAVAASCEAAWFAVMVGQTRTLRDRLLVTVDVLFCLALMLVGTRAAAPHMRNVVATELLPTALDGVQPDVVVSDLHLGQVPIRETVSALVRRSLRVLAISGPATGEEILDAIDAGAQGFADKLEKTSIICAAAAEVAAGGCWIGPKLAGHLLTDAQVRPLRTGDLGSAELSVLRAIAQGDTTQEIAERLGADPTGIRAIYARILDTERRRRGLLQPTPRQSEVLILIGRRGMTQRRAAAQMGITEATLAEHLQNIKDIYLRTHPGAPADITPTHAARLLAEERGLR